MKPFNEKQAITGYPVCLVLDEEAVPLAVNCFLVVNPQREERFMVLRSIAGRAYPEYFDKDGRYLCTDYWCGKDHSDLRLMMADVKAD